jgi:RNA polymerase-binding transcription factor DksA
MVCAMTTSLGTGGNLQAMQTTAASTADELDGIAGHERVLAEVETVLDDVDRALQRLDAGTYGVCEVCGDSIDEETLAASPVVRTCRAHLPLGDRN